MVRLLSPSFSNETSLRRFIFYVIIDAALITSVGFLSYTLFNGVLSPYKRSFHCKDRSIGLPFKRNTISAKFLFIVCILMTFIFVESLECLTLFRRIIKGTLQEKFKRFFVVTTAVNVEFMFGLFIQIAFMQFGKSTFGVLRPHFLDVCRPNFTLIDCSANDGYVLEPHCTSGSEKELKIIRESFPSGHSSTAVYGLCFVLFYTYTRRIYLTKFREKLLTLLLLMLYTVWIGVVLVTRVTDNWHHITDVLGFKTDKSRPTEHDTFEQIVKKAKESFDLKHST
uniref:Phosphatidic acid phosphatase type 2/haloperoxidase domain-containing protein n=1 Tax=Romanomermis culicivorax TaxID=13658 RepID=A0A915J3X0_ROMCU